MYIYNKGVVSLVDIQKLMTRAFFFCAFFESTFSKNSPLFCHLFSNDVSVFRRVTKRIFFDFFENNTVQKNKKMKTLNPNKKMEEHKTHYE